MSITDIDYLDDDDFDVRKVLREKNVFGDIPPEIAELALQIAKMHRNEQNRLKENVDPYDHAMEVIEPPKKDIRFDD